MKVSDGFWLTRNGYGIHWAEQIYEVRTDDSSVTVYAATKKISNRGMTLGGPMLTVRFTSELENSIKVTIEHFSGAGASAPCFQLNTDSSFRPVIKRLPDGGAELISGSTSVRIGREGGDWDISYRFGDRLLTVSGRRSTSFIEEEQWHRRLTVEEQSCERFFSRYDNGGSSYIREMLSISAGERIYGFGEKFTPFVKNGQTAEIWNDDGGTCTEQSYKSVPFFVSSRGYGVFVNDTGRVSFEVGTENVSRTAFSVQGERLEYYLFGGEDIASVIERYTALTGRPSLPPPWSFGLWLSTSFTTEYDEETVSSFIDEMKRRDIPLDVFHFDCFWMREMEWCSFRWDEKKFPEPAAMLARLKEKGVRICVWINPYVGQKSPVYAECLKKGYFIRNRDGSVFQCDMWQSGMSIIDFTNGQAREWFADRIRELAAMGVDAVKTDFGERIPTEVQYADGSDPYKMHNYYSYLYNRTVYGALSGAKGSACLFARSATAGCQQFPVHWGGDCFSDYASMYETLRGGLSLCMSGFGFFSHDIGGFEADGTPDLYKRWTAFGLMSTHSRFHGSSSYRVPWHYDEESCDVARHFTYLKGRLMPYLWANAVKTHLTGIPMMRAMAVDFTHDRSALDADTQYMLGDSLLAAPVFSEDGECIFYLPTGGIWTDIQTGETLSGGSWYTRRYDYFGMPLYARPRSIIVYGNFRGTADYDYADGMKIVIYGMEDGDSAEAAVYDTLGEKAAEIKAVRRGSRLELSVTGTDRPYTAESPQRLEIVCIR